MKKGPGFHEFHENTAATHAGGYMIRAKFRAVFFAAALLYIAAPVSSAQAACASPAGVAGQIVYNTTYRVTQFCNGNEWVAMGAVGGRNGWKQISAGSDVSYGHTCGIKTDGTLWCWGTNSSGRTAFKYVDEKHSDSHAGQRAGQYCNGAGWAERDVRQIYGYKLLIT